MMSLDINAVLRCTAKHAEPRKRLGGKLQGKLTCGELSAQRGSLSGIERTEVGGALRFCSRAQRRERSPTQGKGWNARCERPTSRTMRFMKTRAGRPVNTLVMALRLSRADLRAARWSHALARSLVRSARGGLPHPLPATFRCPDA